MSDGECRRCRALLAEYAAGMLDEPRRLAVERHLRGCAACAAELAEWQTLAAATRRAPTPQPPHGFEAGWDNLTRRLAAQREYEGSAAMIRHDHDETQIDTAQWTRESALLSRSQTTTRAQGGWARALPALAAVLVIAVLSVAIFGWMARGRQTKGVTPMVASPTPAGCTAKQISAQIPPHTNLSALEMTSPQEGWAVGWTQDSILPWQTTGVILHYSHCRWALVDAQLQHMQIIGLSVLPDGEAWATGETDDYSRSFLLHESGGVWQPMTLPASVTAAGAIYRVWMLSPNDGWLELLTQRTVNGQKTDFTTLAHYQAGTWSLVTPPYFSVNDLAPVGPDDIWVTGGLNNTDEPSYIAHYQAGKWVSATVMQHDLRLGSFGTVTPSQGWMSGTTWASDNSPLHMRTLMLRYDGHTWTPVDVGANPQAQDVVMFGAGDGWAMTATTMQPSNPFELRVGLLQHDVGGRWQTVAWPWPDVTVLLEYGLMARAAAGDYWAIGSYHPVATPPASMGSTVLLHYARGAWSQYGG